MAAEKPVWPESAFIDFDRSTPIPLYIQVASRLEEAIRSGSIPPGAYIENEVAISQRLGLARATVRQAISDLVNKGLLIRRRGIGTQVVLGVSREPKLINLYEDLRDASLNPSTEVLTHELRPATAEVAEKLGVEPDSELLYLRRLRFIFAKQQVALLENYLNPEHASITAEQLEEHGLYQLLRARGVMIHMVRQKIGARDAEPAEAELLGLEQNSAVLTMERVTVDITGRPVDFSRHIYRPDRYTFDMTLVGK